MHTRHLTSPAGRPWRRRLWHRRPWHPAAPALLLLTLLGGAGAVQAQQSPSPESLRSQAAERPSRPFQGIGPDALSQSPGNPKALPVQPSAGGGMRQQVKQLSPSQKQQLFSQQKQLQLGFLRDRRQLLQAGEGCLTAATTLDQLRNCMREERLANMDLRRRHMQDMRAMLQGLGIQVPEPPARGGRWGGGPGGPGQPDGPRRLGPGPGSRGEPI
ncbi:MAG: hypothetical protein ACK46L_06775 [Synechococcaceae cyanobacterium]